MSDKTLTEAQVNSLRLADYIEKLPDSEWNIADAEKCFIGHKIDLFGDGPNQFTRLNEGFGDYHELVMPGERAVSTNPDYRYNRDYYTKEKAVRVLRHMALTGKCDWSL